MNACTSKIMIANLQRSMIQKYLFDGNISVPAENAYESILTTKLPNLFERNVNFVETAIKPRRSTPYFLWPDFNDRLIFISDLLCCLSTTIDPTTPIEKKSKLKSKLMISLKKVGFEDAKPQPSQRTICHETTFSRIKNVSGLSRAQFHHHEGQISCPQHRRSTRRTSRSQILHTPRYYVGL